LIPIPCRPIGLIADTHGLLRPEVSTLFAGCGAIHYAGDVGHPEVLAGLKSIAPVYAVRGNNDRGVWAKTLPQHLSVVRGTVRILILHDLSELDTDPVTAGYHVVISGHSHRAQVTQGDGVLYVNPGSAGPRRFTLPLSVAILGDSGRRLRAEIQTITVG